MSSDLALVASMRTITNSRRDMISGLVLALWTILSLPLLTGCATDARLPAVPLAMAAEIKPLGIPKARFYFEDLTSVKAEGFMRELMAKRKRHEGANFAKGQYATSHFLSISGGGDDGAFGAGLLVGWTARGDRPIFRVVTGISTGALSAPFAFLGPDYDDALKRSTPTPLPMTSSCSARSMPRSPTMP